jgi:hypothetical protein
MWKWIKRMLGITDDPQPKKKKTWLTIISMSNKVK